MMERRQMWLEDQFRRQEKDLVKLSRQTHILQDFITLHFDSFRDYWMERDQAERRLDEMNQLPKSVFIRPFSPISLVFSGGGCSRERPMTPDPDNREDNGDEGPVDLSDYPPTASESHNTNSLPGTDSPSGQSLPVDLSTGSRSFGSHSALVSTTQECISPSPTLSPYNDDPKDSSQFTRSDKDRSSGDLSRGDRGCSSPAPTESCTAGHRAVSTSSTSLSPDLTSSYDSVLSRILRADSTQKRSFIGGGSYTGYESRIEDLGADDVETPTTYIDNIPSSSQQPQHLHWSSGSVRQHCGSDSEPNNTPLGSAEDTPTSAHYLNLKFKEVQSQKTEESYDPFLEDPITDYEHLSQPKQKVRKHSKRTIKWGGIGSPNTGRKPKSHKSSSSSSRTTPNTHRQGPRPLSTQSSTQAEDHTHSTNSMDSSSSQGSGSKKCRFCGKTFQWSHSVKTHERLHTGDKPYLCKMCGTRFTQNGNLKVHAKTCVGKYASLYKSKNILVCPLCTEMFESMEALMEHQRSHDRMQWSDKEKTCHVCGVVFQKRSLLLAHEVTHHDHQVRPGPLDLHGPDLKVKVKVERDSPAD